MKKIVVYRTNRMYIVTPLPLELNRIITCINEPVINQSQGVLGWASPGEEVPPWSDTLANNDSLNCYYYEIAIECLSV